MRHSDGRRAQSAGRRRPGTPCNPRSPRAFCPTSGQRWIVDRATGVRLRTRLAARRAGVTRDDAVFLYLDRLWPDAGRARYANSTTSVPAATTAPA